MNKYLLPILILFFGVLYIFLIPDEPMALKLLFKIIPMILIIMYAYRQTPYLKSRTHHLIIIGLIFSMIGDGTLHWFVIGLSAFLIGHLFYIGAFVREATITLPKVAFLLILLPYGFWIAINLVQSLQNNDQQSLIIPVLLYILAILIMGFTAMLTGNIYVLFGSMLFIISDSILAWNKFVIAIDYAGVLIMITYYSAQFLIAHSLATIRKPS